MFPYQIHQALADQHIRDLMTEARRHELRADSRRHARLTAARVATTHAPTTDARERPSRARAAVAQLFTVLHLRRRARTELTVTPRHDAGPMGCVA